MKRIPEIFSCICFLMASVIVSLAQSGTYNSGGYLMPEQAAYDVKFYDLDLFVNPEDSTIDGALTVVAEIVAPLNWLVLDLDARLHVSQINFVSDSNRKLNFTRKEGKLWIKLGTTKYPGEKISIKVFYNGQPLATKIHQKSWSDGFHWAKSKHGEPWLGIVSVLSGADIWWPCKDHPSDRADSMALHIKVPEPLTVVANGKLRLYERLGGVPRMHKFHWFIPTPINNYSVTLNIAQYSKLEDTYRSINGDKIPITFWIMPENYTKAMRLFPQFTKQLAFLERTLGPYPFRRQKYAVVQTPYSGMEHQTIISYGGDFKNNQYGFDQLHFHELTHEWFANMVTVRDWKDWWLQEGLTTYMEAIYAESLRGSDAYHSYIAGFKENLENLKPVAPTTTQRTKDIYGRDLYFKGAAVLHSLRYLVGKSRLLKSFRRLAYPDPAYEYITDGRQCYFITTDDFQRIVEKESGKKLDWFFDVYLRQAELPTLVEKYDGKELELSWDVPAGKKFEMPVEVQIGSQLQKVNMVNGKVSIKIARGTYYEVDPKKWLLKKEPAKMTRKYD